MMQSTWLRVKYSSSLIASTCFLFPRSLPIPRRAGLPSNRMAAPQRSVIKDSSLKFRSSLPSLPHFASILTALSPAPARAKRPCCCSRGYISTQGGEETECTGQGSVRKKYQVYITQIMLCKSAVRYFSPMGIKGLRSPCTTPRPPPMPRKPRST